MFVTENQIYFFLESVFLGSFSCLLYQPFKVVKFFIKSAVFRHIADLLFVFPLILVYFLGSEFFCFPNFRAYAFIGEIFGFYLFEISFGKTLAKVLIFVYNKTISFIRRLNGDGRKKKKARRGKRGNVGNTSLCFNRRIGLSTRFNGCKAKKKRRVAG